jgi:hypothetical protein
MVAPSKDEIRRFGGVVYREIERSAHLDVSLRANLEARSFIDDLTAQRVRLARRAD